MDSIQQQITSDLANKVGDDTSGAIRRGWQFADSAFDKLQIASTSTACAMAYSAAAMNAHLGATHSPEEVADALWQFLRPMVLKNLGGGDAEFRALLARCGGLSHDG